MKKTKSSFPIELILIILSLLMFVFYILFVRYYYARILETTENDTGASYRTFSRQYEMIADSRSNTFWQALYARAAEKAAEADAYVSLNQTGWNTAYDKLDYIDMFIASQVDGIILEYNGEEGLAEKIDEAVAQGIPVVTIINDPNRTQRQSFVGVNDYQLMAVRWHGWLTKIHTISWCSPTGKRNWKKTRCMHRSTRQLQKPIRVRISV